METYCPQCHKPNSTDAQFCRYCAAPLPPVQNQSAGANQGQQPNQQPNQQWNQQGFSGQGAKNYVPSADKASGRAIAALILSACGLFLCCGLVTGVPGAILGWMEITAIREGRASPKGMTFAQLGLWGGIGVSILITIADILSLPLLMSMLY